MFVAMLVMMMLVTMSVVMFMLWRVAADFHAAGVETASAFFAHIIFEI